MRYKKHLLFTIFIVTAFVGVGLKNNIYCSPDNSRDNKDPYGLILFEKELHELETTNKACIVIVGDGIHLGNHTRGIYYKTDDTQGFDLFEGMRAALKETPIDTSRFVFLFVDDGNDVAIAAQIGNLISKCKSVIAVIGHASSSATAGALPYYKAANIPVIMPIATNPHITKGFEKVCFRMPSNDFYQAKFMSEFALNEKQAQRIFLIHDESPSAKQYADYLKTEIQKKLGSKLKGTFAVKKVMGDAPFLIDSALLKAIVLHKPDLMIYCGYGNLAKKYFASIHQLYTNELNNLGRQPSIILSDGCSMPEIKLFHNDLKFNSYISFPCEYGENTRCLKTASIQNHNEFNAFYSYEVLGYDAIKIISSVLEDLKNLKSINRKDILESLQKENFNTSTCNSYRFIKGENQFKSYSIYDLDNVQLIKTYTLKETK